MPRVEPARFRPCSCSWLKPLSLKRPTSLIRQAFVLEAAVVAPVDAAASLLPLPLPPQPASRAVASAAASVTAADGRAFTGSGYLSGGTGNLRSALEQPGGAR